VSGGALGMGLMGGEDHQELPVNWFADFSLPSTSPEGRPDADGEPVLRWHQGVGAAQRVRVQVRRWRAAYSKWNIRSNG
jgi:hypothetical protein